MVNGTKSEVLSSTVACRSETGYWVSTYLIKTNWWHTAVSGMSLVVQWVKLHIFLDVAFLGVLLVIVIRSVKVLHSPFIHDSIPITVFVSI